MYFLASVWAVGLVAGGPHERGGHLGRHAGIRSAMPTAALFPLADMAEPHLHPVPQPPRFTQPGLSHSGVGIYRAVAEGPKDRGSLFVGSAVGQVARTLARQRAAASRRTAEG